MAWGEIKVENQRKEFIEHYLKGQRSFAELCRQFEISRKNGYKWVKRFKEEGLQGLQDRSRAPWVQASAIDSQVVEEILQLKFKEPLWGPKKILGHLQCTQPSKKWPSLSCVDNILKRNGLVVKRKYKRKVPERTTPFSSIEEINDTWCTDFKGWWLTQNGSKCDPFTLMDTHSRFLLRCLKLDRNDTDHVWAVFDTVFRECGLPLYVRFDNGPPFGSCGAGRLSSLSVKLIKAGIIPEWIDPGKPQQNGRHERMHGTLQRQVRLFPSFDLIEQQKKLDEFQHHYNFIRPHESLGQKTPGSVYKPSLRNWSGRLKSPEYDTDYIVRKVGSCGKTCWKSTIIYISRALANEPVGFKENEEGLFEVYYGPIFLGTMDRENNFSQPTIKRKKVDRIKAKG